MKVDMEEKKMISRALLKAYQRAIDAIAEGSEDSIHYAISRDTISSIQTKFKARLISTRPIPEFEEIEVSEAEASVIEMVIQVYGE